MMLAWVLGEVMAVLNWNMLICLGIVPVLVVIKIITKKQVSLFVMIFLCLCLSFMVVKHEINISESIYKLDNQATVIGNVSNIKENNLGWYIYLENISLYYEENEPINCDTLHITTQNCPGLEIGYKIQVEGQINHFESARNEGNFDSKEYYKSIGIYTRVEAKKISILSDEKDEVRIILNDLKERFCGCLDNICASDKAAIYKALLLGDKEQLDEQIKDLYSITGIAHILAISGLHISIIGMFLYSTMRKRFGFVLSASISIVVVVAFCIISGMGIATIRAVVMFALKLLGEILGRVYDYTTAISLSGILLMLDNPFVILNSGFQMSFVAIISITLIWPMIKDFFKIRNKFKKVMLNVVSGINISIMMNPIIAYYYFQLPTYSFLLNLIVIPLMNVVMISGILGILLSFFCIWLGKICIIPGSIILDFYTHLCTIVSRLPFANVIVGKPDIIVIVVYYVAYIIFLYTAKKYKKATDRAIAKMKDDIPKEGRDLSAKAPYISAKQKVTIKLRVVLMAVYLALSLAIYNPFRKISNVGNFQTTFLDVGQGDSIYMKTDNGTTVLVDGGSTSVDNVGKYRIIPFIKAQGVSKIDYAIVTHTDIDHISGLIEIIEESDNNGILIENLVMPNITFKDEMYLDLVELSQRHNINILYISQGEKMSLGEVRIECISPAKELVAEDKNDSSTVLSVTYGDFSMLLTGDISMNIEEEIKEKLLDEYTVLKVAHHGSKYSTSNEFLENINPQCSIISVGENNMYGHPSGEVLKRLEYSKSIVLRTDMCGGITIIVNDGKIEIEKTINEDGEY